MFTEQKTIEIGESSTDPDQSIDVKETIININFSNDNTNNVSNSVNAAHSVNASPPVNAAHPVNATRPVNASTPQKDYRTMYLTTFVILFIILFFVQMLEIIVFINLKKENIY